MSSYGNHGQNGPYATPPNNRESSASFSSRITSFDDIADVSISHLQFDDSPSTHPQYAAPSQKHAIPVPYPQKPVPSIAASPSYSAYAPSPGVSSHAIPLSGFPQTQHIGSHDAQIRQPVSAMSLQSQFDAHGGPLRGRESLVSIQSSYDAPNPLPQPDPYRSQTTYTPATSWIGGPQSRGYEPVSAVTPSDSPLSHSTSRGSRRGRRSRHGSSFPGQHETIPEEEYDMAILPAAAPMGKQDQTYQPLPIHDDIDVGFDPTSTLGPVTVQDDSFVKRLQRQEEEAKGHLTGGLGTGWKTEGRLLGSELLRSPSRLQRSITRRFTHRQPRGRAEVLRDMGQEEANRRGKVIEVVMDEPAGVDISAMVGPEGIGGSDEDSPTKTKTAQVFYPQPNWKPFSMRWPYLSLLVFLSLGLAVVQEVFYQKSKNEPLVTFRTPDEITPLVYFAVKFLPTIVAVTFGVLWQVTDFEVRRLEAFYQLSKPGGADAEESLSVDYVTSINIFRPFHALSLKHYAVSVSSLGAVLAISLVPTFCAASIQLTPDRQQRMENPDMEKHIVVNAVWSRLLTSTLAICALSACILFFLLQTRRSGLQSDVKGIAGLASMAVVCHILMDFKDMDTATHETIHNKLRCRRYMLRNCALAPDDEKPSSSELQDEGRFQHSHLSENPHPLMLTAVGFICYVIGVALFTGFVTAVVFTEATVVTDKAPWVITFLAVCVKLGWSTLDTDIRMMEPYYILSRRHAPPRTLTLDYTAMPFGYMPWRAFRNGHTLMGLVGLGSIVAEILTVLLTSLAAVDGRGFVAEASGMGDLDDKDAGLGDVNSGQETVASFFGSLAFALLILLYISIVGTLVFARRRHPFLPRQPNTIASVLAYIHQSKMLYDFVGTSQLSGVEMADRLERTAKTYGLGWFQGRDGQSHCGVDEEELTGGYRHGLQLGEINKPWATQWSVF